MPQETQHRFPPDDDHDPADHHHRKPKFKRVDDAVLIGGIQQGSRFAVEGEHIDVFNEQGYRKGQAHDRIIKFLGNAYGNRNEDQGPHSLGLEQNVAEQHDKSQGEV